MKIKLDILKQANLNAYHRSMMYKRPVFVYGYRDGVYVSTYATVTNIEQEDGEDTFKIFTNKGLFLFGP